MYLHDINYLINLQDITITNFSISENQSLFFNCDSIRHSSSVSLLPNKSSCHFDWARVKTIEQLDI